MATAYSLRPNGDLLWEKAIDTLSEDDKSSIDWKSLDRSEVLDEALRLTNAAKDRCDRKSWRFARKSGQVVIVRDVLSKVARWINEFKAVGDTIIQYDTGHAAIPWAGVRFVLQICVKHFETHEFLVENIEYIARHLCYCQVIEKHLTHSSGEVEELKRALFKLYARILIYLARVKAYFEQSTMINVLKSLTSESKKFKDLLEEVTKARPDVDHWCLVVDIQGLKQDLARLEEPMKRWDETLTQITDGLQEAEREKILEWISQESYRTYHKLARKGFLEGTGEWLLSDPVYKKWKRDSASSLLWLRGIPGSGKTKLTSLVIEDAEKAFRNNQDPSPVYFYCSRNPAEPARSDPQKILASIVRQLSALKPGGPLCDPTIEVYKELKDGNKPGSMLLDESFDLLMKLLELRKTGTVIIIDAFDECDPRTRQGLLYNLERVLQESITLVKIFISSRNDLDIVDTLQIYPSLEISLHLNSRDINCFVKHELTTRKITSLIGIESKERGDMLQKIYDTISKGANGMFLWASLQLDALCPLSTLAAVDEQLTHLPRKLEDLYKKIVQEIKDYDPIDRHYATNALAWLLCGQWVLKSDAFLTAVSTFIDSPSHLLHKDQVLHLCRNLVIYDDTDDTFKFAHLSVREFLESKPALEFLQSKPVPYFLEDKPVLDFLQSKPETSKESANRIAAESCLQALVNSPEQDRQCGFYEYAAWNWMKHIHHGSVDRDMTSPAGQLLWKFLGHAESFNRWYTKEYRGMRVPLSFGYGTDWIKLVDNSPDQHTRRLVVASAFHLSGVVRLGSEGDADNEILRKCVKLLAYDRACETLSELLKFKGVAITEALLIEVVRNGSHKVTGTLNVLLDANGGKMEITEDVVKAAASNDLRGGDIMELLLKENSDSLPITGDVVKAAAANWYQGKIIMELLFEKKGDHLPITEDVVKAAAANWYQGKIIMELLFEKKGDHLPITEDVVKTTAAHWYQGKEIMELLFEKKVDNLPITEDVTKTAAANRYQGKEIMELLFERRDPLEITEEVVKTAASNGGCGDEVMKLLFEKKGDNLPITEDVIKTAAANSDGLGIMSLLFERRDQLEITEEVVKTAASIGGCGDGIMELLFKERDQLELTEDVVKSAASNRGCRDNIRDLLFVLNQRYNWSRQQRTDWE